MMTFQDEAQIVDAFKTIHDATGDGGLRYAQAGSGEPVLVLCGTTEPEPSRFHALLAEQFQVTLVSNGDAAVDAISLRECLADVKIEAVSLICADRFAEAGLELALSAPQAVKRLILIAPKFRPTERFGQVTVPVLVLEGTVDRGDDDDVGQTLAGLIPECFDILIYDATQSLEIERPEATASVVADFIDRGSGFILTKPKGPIHP